MAQAKGLRDPAPPLRRLSQNFLTDRGVADRIVASFAPAPADEVVEIGPGRGILTERLAGRVSRLVAAEIDRRLAATLAARLAGAPGVEVLHRDILSGPLADLVPGRRPRVIANLPYGISSAVVLKLCDEAGTIAGAQLMLQLEFAARLAARPRTHDYGSLSALVQARLVPEPLFEVGPAAFRPRPRVRSRLVRLVPRDPPLASGADWHALKRLLRAGFSARRKQLAGTLAGALGRPRGEIEAWLARFGIGPTSRPEEVDPETWAALARSGPGPAGGPAF